MNKNFNIKNLLSTIFSFGFIVWFVVNFYILPPPDFPLNQIISIKNGDNLEKISEELKEKKLFYSSFFFKTIVQLAGMEKKIKAGQYVFKEKLNIFELIKTLSSNSSQGKVLKITIPEGFTLYDIADLFEKSGLFSKEKLWEVTGDPLNGCLTESCFKNQEEFSKRFPLLSTKPKNTSLEGFFFPDTYFILKDANTEAVVSLVLGNLEKKITPRTMEAVRKSGHSFFEVLTMASLIEKEASEEKDRKLISGILWKRLLAGMPLQVDAVFRYIIGKNSFELTKKDLKTDSPYNTYLYKGLPPAPIANPGLSSINAALFPEKSDYWYYFSDKKGKTYYSASYKDHLAKKARFLK
jgi:UPF0755 protein